MASQDYTELTNAHDANAAKGKAAQPYQKTVQRTREEEDRHATMKPEDRLTDYRKILAERGVPK